MEVDDHASFQCRWYLKELVIDIRSGFADVGRVEKKDVAGIQLGKDIRVDILHTCLENSASAMFICSRDYDNEYAVGLQAVSPSLDRSCAPLLRAGSKIWNPQHR